MCYNYKHEENFITDFGGNFMESKTVATKGSQSNIKTLAAMPYALLIREYVLEFIDVALPDIDITRKMRIDGGKFGAEMFAKLFSNWKVKNISGIPEIAYTDVEEALRCIEEKELSIDKLSDLCSIFYTVSTESKAIADECVNLYAKLYEKISAEELKLLYNFVDGNRFLFEKVYELCEKEPVKVRNLMAMLLKKFPQQPPEKMIFIYLMCRK